jgi:hypothetical protein
MPASLSVGEEEDVVHALRNAGEHNETDQIGMLRKGKEAQKAKPKEKARDSSNDEDNSDNENSDDGKPKRNANKNKKQIWKNVRHRQASMDDSEEDK